jgi:hypothetical protein
LDEPMSSSVSRFNASLRYLHVFHVAIQEQEYKTETTEPYARER